MNKRIVLGLAFLTIVVLSSCKQTGDTGNVDVNTNAVSVKSALVQTVEYRDTIRASGVLVYNKESNLSFKTGGIIDRIEVHEGQYVRKGDLLASVKQDEIKASVLQAQSALDKAQRDYDRVLGLYNDSVATLEQLQNAKTQLTTSKASLNAISFNQTYSSIKAPSSGVIQKVLTDENEMVGAGSPVLIFGSEAGGKVFSTSVPDVDVVRLNTGDTVILHFDARNHVTFHGVVQEIAGMANANTGTYEVKVAVDDAQNMLLPGFIGAASFITANLKTGYQIPVESLVQADKEKGEVYIINNDKVKRQSVIIKGICGNHLIVSSGLNPTDKVIYEGLDNVRLEN